MITSIIEIKNFIVYFHGIFNYDLHHKSKGFFVKSSKKNTDTFIYWLVLSIVITFVICANMAPDQRQVWAFWIWVLVGMICSGLSGITDKMLEKRNRESNYAYTDNKHEYKINDYINNETQHLIKDNKLTDTKDIYAAELVATNKINHSPRALSNIYNISLDKAKEIEESITIQEEKKIANHTAYEGRISTTDKNKLKAILGYKCSACGADMSKIYGDIGQHYIELHHKIPYSNIRENETRTLTEQEFCVLCPNCHRMIHKLPDAGDIDLLTRIIKLNRKTNDSN